MCYNILNGDCMNRKIILFIVALISIIIFIITLDYFCLLPRRFYSSSDFEIDVVHSDMDYNNNGIDDYTDILIGAKKEAKNHSTYKSAYYSGGYPPSNEGVCTDVIWRALKEAGYFLKDLIDADIKKNKTAYDIDTPDPNIDFRRVVNIHVYLERNTIKLTNDPYQIEEWQPGDIVVFKKHVAIISDKRNKYGIPYIIHNAGQPNREEDTLLRWYKNNGIIGHYRFSINTK